VHRNKAGNIFPATASKKKSFILVNLWGKDKEGKRRFAGTYLLDLS
jgi:hypothetical protein